MVDAEEADSMLSTVNAVFVCLLVLLISIANVLMGCEVICVLALN